MPLPGASTYKETRVKTAGQGSLIVMLYEEAIRRLETAVSKVSPSGKVAARDSEPYHASVLKAQEIVGELMVSLDMERGGNVAKNLMALYIYFNQELLTLGMKADSAKLVAVKDMMAELRDAWQVAATQAAAVTPAAARPVLDIQG
jgi:flagellar protein FliS